MARFALGTAAGLSPLVLVAAFGWTGPLAGYFFWLPDEYAGGLSAFHAANVSANAREYLGTLLGLPRHTGFYALPVPLLTSGGLLSNFHHVEGYYLVASGRTPYGHQPRAGDAAAAIISFRWAPRDPA
jgi:hypothetical protein